MLTRPIVGLFEQEDFYYPQDAVAVRLKGSGLPHFGLIFEIPIELCKVSIEGVLSIVSPLLGEHSDYRNWDFVELERDPDKVRLLLLVPKRYVFIVTALVFFIHLVPED